MPRSLRLATFVVLLVVLARCAWVSDDAYVTLRTLEHLLGGHGPRFNVAERVQAFTHPLWLGWLLGPVALTGEAWLTPMAVGWLTTAAAAAALAFGVARSEAGGAVVLGGLVASKAAVDYGTSGLENPLEALLLVGFAGEWFGRRRLLALTALAALLGTTRLDGLLLVGPALVMAAAERPSELRIAWVGLAPLALWHLFALGYYGALLPNTAPAKLGSGVPVVELVAQSRHLFLYALRHDPLTLAGIGAGLVVGARSRDGRALAAGIALHLAYVAWIGGDFMAGRFFVAPLWLAAALIASQPMPARWAPLGAALIAASALLPYAPIRSGPGYEKAPPDHGVVDERGYYWRGTGLWGGSSWRDGPSHAFAREGRAEADRGVVVKSVIGLYGWAAGPELHVVDRLGLAEPLLARLPADPDPDWRIGHFRRTPPAGYLRSVQTGENHVEDPEIRALYDDVLLATRAPLLAPGRLGAILRLHGSR